MGRMGRIGLKGFWGETEVFDFEELNFLGYRLMGRIGRIGLKGFGGETEVFDFEELN